MPFQGVAGVMDVTRRVAAGWLILPFQGLRKVGNRW
jgi:hypothetical protein